MKVAVFGGSFDPVHKEHVRLTRAAIEALKLDKVLIMPSYRAPHKSGSLMDGKARLKACEIAFRNIPQAEVCDYELSQGGISYSYLTCRYFARRFPDAERYFLVGADMLENFFSWRDPDEIVSLVKIAACGRGEALPTELHARFQERFGCDFTEVPFVGERVSSTKLRVLLAFREATGGLGLEALDEKVLAYLAEGGFYRYPAAERALALEKPARQLHSYRVALMACTRARSLGISEEKALLAAMLHDCGKYLPTDSPLYAGFVFPSGVPEPVAHQYGGAYLAKHEFGIEDEEILDAIRYHTSGREDMTPLGKLIFLADLLEDERDFEGVKELRKLFYEDFEECFYRALERQIEYLKRTGRPVYPLTERAYEWLKAHKSR